MATMLYTSDYSDRLMPINQRPGSSLDYKSDRTWVQLVLPYARSFSIFRCPGDKSDRPGADLTFDQDLLPDDTYSQFYTASLRTNIGYNYMYLAPIYRQGGEWLALPKTVTQLPDPSSTILFIDSIWDRDENGRPTGGGNWLVVPPCRYTFQNGNMVDSFSPFGSGVFGPKLFYTTAGWNSADKNSRNLYGNAWPWHGDRMNMVHVDGSVTSIHPRTLTAGCSFTGAGWEGSVIRDLGSYLWD